jgi:CheY-like chemotaxis protein
MATPSERVTLPPNNILVVDDEPMVAGTVRLVLEMNGQKVELAENAETALERFAPGKYGLVVTDFKLMAMDGLELAEKIRQQSPTQPIILLTAYAESLRGDKQRLANVNCVLGKPFSVQQLLEALTSVLGGK